MRTYEAIQLAIKAHDKQFRKLDGDIYAAHPIEVGIILASNNYETDIIIAGILHDTVEDTYVTLDDIASQFGNHVRSLVDGCSENDKSLAWKNRKLNALDTVENCDDIGVKLIFCADKLSNIQSIIRYKQNSSDKDLWSKFNAGFEDQKWYYTESLRVLNDLKDTKMYLELKDSIDIVFYSEK
ncbi:MAG: HD domain-containing protein [Acidaminobacteraceae bacterium]